MYESIKHETQSTLLQLNNNREGKAYHPHGVVKIEYEIGESVYRIYSRRYWVSHVVFSDHNGVDVYDGYNLYTAIFASGSLVDDDIDSAGVIFLKHVRLLETVNGMSTAYDLLNIYIDHYRAEIAAETYDCEREDIDNSY